MKYLKSTVFSVVILFVTFSSLPRSSGQSNGSEASAELRISTTKSEYMLGEPVRLERTLVKIGDYTRLRFPPGDDFAGLLRVFIAREGGEFLEYRFGAWDLSNRESSDGPGTSKTFKTIFLNKKPVTWHLSDYGRRIAEKGMMLTDYAFPAPGEYRIKAIRGYSVRRGTDRYATSATARSNEISIRVKEPEGDDLNVWEIMKSDPDIGYFMMVGDAPDRVPSIESTVLTEVNRIVSEYPDSYLAGLLKVKLQDHRVRQERRQRDAERDRLKREQEKSGSAARKN